MTGPASLDCLALYDYLCFRHRPSSGGGIYVSVNDPLDDARKDELLQKLAGKSAADIDRMLAGRGHTQKGYEGIGSYECSYFVAGAIKYAYDARQYATVDALAALAAWRGFEFGTLYHFSQAVADDIASGKPQDVQDIKAWLGKSPNKKWIIARVVRDMDPAPEKSTPVLALFEEICAGSVAAALKTHGRRLAIYSNSTDDPDGDFYRARAAQGRVDMLAAFQAAHLKKIPPAPAKNKRKKRKYPRNRR